MAAEEQKKDAPTEKPANGFFRRNLSTVKKFCCIGWEFSKELWKDHQFWVNAIAVKGGAVAMVGGAIVGLSFAFTYPFIIAAGVILLCATAMAAGGIGIVAGCSKLWEKLKETYYKTTGKEPPAHPAEKKKSFSDRLKEKPLVQKALQHRYAQKFFASRTWKTVRRLREKQEELLNSLAIGGSVAYTGLGAWLLAAQIVALPVVALPMLITVAAITGASYIVSGGVGLWISMKNLFDRRREKKEAAAMAAAAQENAPETSETANPQLLPVPLKPRFDEANSGQPPANDDCAAVPTPQKKIRKG